MGYIRHNAIIVTAAGYAMEGSYVAAAPDVAAFRDSLPEQWRHLVIGPVKSVMNDYQSFAFLPDGSKEGWKDSDLGDEYPQAVPRPVLVRLRRRLDAVRRAGRGRAVRRRRARCRV
jgi:hypothetical protein